MDHIDLLDSRFQKAYNEVRGAIEEPTEVYVFDHMGGYLENPIHTRTFMIPWEDDQTVIIQTHFWREESEPQVVRLPEEAVRFMGHPEVDKRGRAIMIEPSQQG